MNRQEVTALLALMSGRDGRAVGQVEIEAWLEDLGRWDFDTAREAVRRHYTTTRDFARPFDVIKLIRAVRDERLIAAGHITPPARLADNPAAEIAWMRSRREAIAAGRIPPTAATEELLRGSEHPEITGQVRAIAASMAVPPAPVTDPARPAPNVEPARAEATEAERRRQLAALDSLNAQVP